MVDSGFEETLCFWMDGYQAQPRGFILFYFIRIKAKSSGLTPDDEHVSKALDRVILGNKQEICAKAKELICQFLLTSSKTMSTENFLTSSLEQTLEFG